MDYKALYFTAQQQIPELAAMVDRYQNEIIPQYIKLLEKASGKAAELEDRLEVVTQERDRLAALLDMLSDAKCPSLKREEVGHAEN